MSLSKYTLDRYDDGFAVLLKHPDEQEQLLVPQYELQHVAKEGDLLVAEQTKAGYVFKVLEKETQDVKGEVQELIEKLKRNSK